MELLKAIFLGFIQGVTEFLPVSSSGHLAIFKHVLGMEDVDISFDILLYLGTLIAVSVVYWRDIARLFFDGVGIVVDSCTNIGMFFRMKFSGERLRYRIVTNSAYRKFALLVIVSTIPTGIIGALGKGIIEKASASLLIPAVLGAAVMDLKDFGSEGLEGTDVFDYIVGMAVAALVGSICIKTMLVIVKKKKFRYFAYYCYTIGMIAITGHFVVA